MRLFEIGRVFRRDPRVADGPLTVSGVAQPTCVAGLAYGPADDEQWSVATRDVDYFDVKGDVERLFAPSACSSSSRRPIRRCTPVAARASCSAGREIGVIGELHPRLQHEA